MKLAKLITDFDPRTKVFGQPFIIAEIGVNHEGSMDIAKRLIEEACRGGANAVKFQTYKAETLASKDSPAYWDISKEPTTSQYELFKKHDKFWKSEFESLLKVSEEFGVEFLSTPFDVESAVFLNEMMSTFKISSSDLSNKMFIDFLCGFNKPVLLSTGASDLWEIFETVSWIQRLGNPFALMHCVLNYPTPDEHANLGMISGLIESFPGVAIGYSDHTLPKDMKTLEIATLLGAAIIEKHFTHNKELPGNDHYHAMDWKDLQIFRNNMERVISLYGSAKVSTLSSENKSKLNARRSLVAAQNIKKGSVIKKADLTFKRPASGISPKHYEKIIGQTATQDIPEDTILKWTMLS